MDKRRSAYTSSELKERKKISKDASKKAKGECEDSVSSSHTQFFRRDKYEEEHRRITTDEYFGISETISSTSDSFHCIHGQEGRQYTEKNILKRNFIKELDPIATDHKWNDECPPAYGWDIAHTLVFLVNDPVGQQQTERIAVHLRDFARIARFGYKIEVLNSLSIILDYLVENLKNKPNLFDGTTLLMRNIEKPILLTVASDINTQFGSLVEYIGFLGFLLLRVESEELFDLVSKGLLWQLSSPDGIRGLGSVQRRHVISAACSPGLLSTVSRMLALASPRRFTIFQQIAFLLACHAVDNCIEMIKENIIENIFYRFNPYFPDKNLPDYEENPLDPQDFNVKLGESSKHMSTTLSLLLVLFKTLKIYLDENPNAVHTIPCPDYYAQRCFLWAYRYECRARGHCHERITMTVIAHVFLNCFRERLMPFSSLLMPDVMALSVLTEVPPRQLWIRTVNFSTSQVDVQFKKVLIRLSADLLKMFPCNKFMVESECWLLGLMFLLDPGLCQLRARWSPALFSEIRKTTLQALVGTLHLMPPRLVAEYGIIRRIMWYIEWYSENPFELSLLYWCVRLLLQAIHSREEPTRLDSLQDLFDTHGIIIIMHLCYTLLEQRYPPVEKSQVVLALSVRLLTSAVEAERRVSCCVYPSVKWPASINALAGKMLEVALYSLDKHLLVSDRWLVALLNFIWEAIVWRKKFREKFILREGVYKLLDLITMSKPPIQCMSLAMLCDIARSGEAVAQLVTWRANLGASNAYPSVVKRGATIATLLASVFRDDCLASGVQLDDNGIIQNIQCPLMSPEVIKEMANPDFCEGPHSPPVVCLAAVDVAASRMSKAFGILQILSEDLQHKVSIADQSYNMYKNIQLAPEDETILVLCSNYLTLKLNEVWTETKAQNSGFLPQDIEILDEFLEINGGWAREVKIQQEDVLRKYNKNDVREEKSLYAFLAQVRLNSALDALREVRCVARSAAARARSGQPQTRFYSQSLTPIQTYQPPLDDLNMTGQYVKVHSIQPKNPKSTRHATPSKLKAKQSELKLS